MHPGWADTPAVQSSMPDFHRQMKNRFRTPQEGADTVVWLAIADKALDKKNSGKFFQGILFVYSPSISLNCFSIL